MNQQSEWTYSAVIRCRNSGHTLRCMLHHLKSQTIPPGQIIVVDSGSRDNSIDIALNEGCLIVNYPESETFNYSKAINIGLQEAHCSWALIISSDVLLLSKNAIENLMVNMDRQGCRFGYLNGDNETALHSRENSEVRFKVTDWNRFNGFNGLHNSCGMIRIEDWKVLPFDENLAGCEDEFWASKMLHLGNQCMELTVPPFYKISNKGTVSFADRAVIVNHCLPPLRRTRHILAIFKRLGFSLACLNFTRSRTEICEITYHILYNFGYRSLVKKCYSAHFRRFGNTTPDEIWIQ